MANLEGEFLRLSRKMSLSEDAAYRTQHLNEIAALRDAALNEMKRLSVSFGFPFRSTNYIDDEELSTADVFVCREKTSELRLGFWAKDLRFHLVGPVEGGKIALYQPTVETFGDFYRQALCLSTEPFIRGDQAIAIGR